MSAESQSHVLLMDGNIENARLWGSIFELTGFRVTTCLPIRVFTILEKTPADLLISGFGLGHGIDGKVVAQRVREENLDMPVIILSDSLSQAEQEEIVRSNIADRVFKRPYNRQELEDLLEQGKSLINEYRSRRQISE